MENKIAARLVTIDDPALIHINFFNKILPKTVLNTDKASSKLPKLLSSFIKTDPNPDLIEKPK